MKKQRIVLKSNMTFGAVAFSRFGGEFIYNNPTFGNVAPGEDYLYTTQKEPICYITFDEKTGGVNVTAQFTIQELRKMLRVAEKRTKKFKGEGHFVHAGNLSIFVKGRHGK
jgi:hypothetical protein